MDGFPSGQRGQTVNLLATPSKVRILLHPLEAKRKSLVHIWAKLFSFYRKFIAAQSARARRMRCAHSLFFYRKDLVTLKRESIFPIEENSFYRRVCPSEARVLRRA